MFFGLVKWLLTFDPAGGQDKQNPLGLLCLLYTSECRNNRHVLKFVDDAVLFILPQGGEADLGSVVDDDKC